MFKSIKGCLLEGRGLVGWGEREEVMWRQNSAQYKGKLP